MVIPDPSVPGCGDAVWIDFDPQKGHEQAGRRPALVLSPREYNDMVGLVLVCPITKQAKGYPFEVDIPDGLGVSGVILADHIKSVDWRARKATRIQALPPDTVSDVVNKLGHLLGQP